MKKIYTNRHQEFLEHRTSFKFFERLASKETDSLFPPLNHGLGRVLIEILKELQFMNDNIAQGKKFPTYVKEESK